MSSIPETIIDLEYFQTIKLHGNMISKLPDKVIEWYDEWLEIGQIQIEFLDVGDENEDDEDREDFRWKY